MCTCKLNAVGRRKTTSKATAKNKVAASPATIMVAGIGRYKKAACSSTKTGAAATAEKIRATGRKARVVKSGNTFCVYERGKANPAAKKTTAKRTTTKRTTTARRRKAA